MPRSALRVVDAAIADEIRRAVRLAMGFDPITGEGWAADYLHLSEANAALFMLDDAGFPLSKLPRIGSKPMRHLVEGLMRAAGSAEADGKGEIATALEEAANRIDLEAVTWWYEVGKAERARLEALQNAPPKPLERGVYVHNLQFRAIDSHGEEIVTLYVNGERGMNKHERHEIVQRMYDILRYLDVDGTLDELAAEQSDEKAEADDSADDDAGEEWKRGGAGPAR